MNRILILMLILPSWLYGQDTNLVINNSRLIYDNCIKGDFKTVTSYFDKELLYRMDAERLKQTWGLIEGQIGKAIPLDEPKIHIEKVDSLIQVYHSCNFEKKDMDLKLVFNSSNRVVGFFFVPPSAKFTYQPPAWVSAGKVKEKEIEIPSADLRLKGKLTLPAEGDNFPLVILVHGSGPQDMDLTIGPNQVFKDIAISLAATGVAVLRYDKRTKAYMSEMVHMIPYMTPDEETVEDAVAAVNFAGTLASIDHDRIFILGHSFGGMMAPQIASKSKQIKGLVLMAANARPIQDLIMEQLKYISNADSGNAAMKQSLDMMQVKVDRVNSKSYTDSTDLALLPMNIGPPYWRYLENYDQFKTAAELKIPILIVQGERDYQVTMEDFKIWKEKLQTRPSTTFKSFPKLNHLFIAGDGPSYPVEYDTRSNVDRSAMEFISNWIRTVGK